MRGIIMNFEPHEISSFLQFRREQFTNFCFLYFFAAEMDLHYALR